MILYSFVIKIIQLVKGYKKGQILDPPRDPTGRRFLDLRTRDSKPNDSNITFIKFDTL